MGSKNSPKKSHLSRFPKIATWENVRIGSIGRSSYHPELEKITDFLASFAEEGIRHSYTATQLHSCTAANTFPLLVQKVYLFPFFNRNKPHILTRSKTNRSPTTKSGHSENDEAHSKREAPTSNKSPGRWHGNCRHLCSAEFRRSTASQRRKRRSVAKQKTDRSIHL